MYDNEETQRKQLRETEKKECCNQAAKKEEREEKQRSVSQLAEIERQNKPSRESTLGWGAESEAEMTQSRQL